MDLLGGLGDHDQLISARAELAVLSAKVKELTSRVKELELDNATLLAEVEIYRKEAALPSFSKLALGDNSESKDSSSMQIDDDKYDDHFVRSGDGYFAEDPAVTLKNVNGHSNPITCCLNPDDTLLATGGADSYLSLYRWGSALSPSPDASEKLVQNATKISCGAPLIASAFSQQSKFSQYPQYICASGMDGSVHINPLHDDMNFESPSIIYTPESNKLKHGKYAKCLAWSPSEPLIASASADGTVYLTKVNHSYGDDGNLSQNLQLDVVEKFHLQGAVEAMCFLNGGKTLCCYSRGTSYLSYFHLDDDCNQTKFSLNGEVTGGFDSHVSFAVMSLSPSPGDDGKYLAAATDTSRNIILEAKSSKQIRNLYGHKNDGFSQPKIGWSKNGKYIYGNTQDENCVCVWDCASSSIVKKLDGHGNTIRDLYSSKLTDTLVTVSFDKTAKVWLPSMG